MNDRRGAHAGSAASRHAPPATGASHHAPPGASQLHPGWQPVAHEELPQPTYWPAALAFGITLMAWGIITTWIITAVGTLIFIVALAGWIGDLRHGHE